MPTNNPPLLEQRSFVSHVMEEACSTLTRATPHIVTDAASIGQTSFTSAALAAVSSGNDDFLGYLLEAQDGNCKGQLVQIREYTDSTGAVTHDPFLESSPDYTQLRVWIPSDPIVPVTGGTATTTVSADRGSDSVDLYGGVGGNRYYLVSIGDSAGSTIARGENRVITDFATTSGTFTHAAFSDTPAVGDHMKIRQPLLAAGAELTLPEATTTYIDRKFTSRNLSRDPGVIGRREGSFEMPLEAKGASRAASSTAGAQAPLELRDILDSCMQLRTATGSTLDADSDGDGSSDTDGGTTSAPTVPTANGAELFTPGNLVLIDGELALISSITDGGAGADTLNVTPALTNTPQAVAVDNVFGTATYHTRNTGFRSHTVETFLEDVRRTLYGWKFGMRLEGVAGNEIPRFIFAGPFDAHVTNDISGPEGAGGSDEWVPTFDSNLPRAAGPALVKFDGTAIVATSFTVDLGAEHLSKSAVTGAFNKDGIFTSMRNPNGSLTVWLENADFIHRFENDNAHSLLVQVGSLPGACWGVYIDQLQFTNATIGKDQGGFTVELPFNVLRGSTSITPTSGSAFTVEDMLIGFA